ncbi:MAG: hypothetical protein MZU79_05140 [Anaerotruncus sp.]|nr:hypothetical protein [Anaerotruncus sp.]
MGSNRPAGPRPALHFAALSLLIALLLGACARRVRHVSSRPSGGRRGRRRLRLRPRSRAPTRRPRAASPSSSAGPGFGRVEAVDPIGRTAFLVLFRGDRAWFVLPGTEGLRRGRGAGHDGPVPRGSTSSPTRACRCSPGSGRGVGARRAAGRVGTRRSGAGSCAAAAASSSFTVRDFFPGDGVPRRIELAGRGTTGPAEGPRARPSTRPRGRRGRSTSPFLRALRPEDLGRRSWSSSTDDRQVLRQDQPRPRDRRQAARTAITTSGRSSRRSRSRDEIDLEPAPARHRSSSQGTIPRIAWDRTNLVDRAARKAPGEGGTGRPGPGSPCGSPSRPAGGLGGGSSNAAATLLALGQDVGSRPGGGPSWPAWPGASEPMSPFF